MEPALYPLMSVLEANHWWFAARRAIVERIIRNMALPANATILDAGCGTGGNLAMLARHGQVHAMELDEQARHIANTKNITQVVRAKLPDEVPYPKEQFDLVVLLDVLEHVEDDGGTLRTLGTLLKPGGRLLVTVPAFPFLWSPHDSAHHHKRRYYLNALKSQARGAGLAIVYASYFNTLLFPLIAVARLLGKFSKEARANGDLTMPNHWVNRLLFTLFSSERFVIGRWPLPFGVSAMVVATREIGTHATADD